MAFETEHAGDEAGQQWLIINDKDGQRAPLPRGALDAVSVRGGEQEAERRALPGRGVDRNLAPVLLDRAQHLGQS
jgi:hypothetical protein